MAKQKDYFGMIKAGAYVAAEGFPAKANYDYYKSTGATSGDALVGVGKAMMGINSLNEWDSQVFIDQHKIAGGVLAVDVLTQIFGVQKRVKRIVNGLFRPFN